MDAIDEQTCPACGGAGGGPLGRAGGAWDDEEYVCPRCRGRGLVPLSPGVKRAAGSTRPPVGMPGVAKAAPPEARPQKKHRAG